MLCHFFPLVRLPIVSGHRTRNIYQQPMKRKVFTFYKNSAGKIEPTYWEKMRKGPA